MKHKHYELITKWAANPAQYRVEKWVPSWCKWTEVVGNPIWNPENEYRLVPKKEHIRIEHRKCMQKINGQYLFTTVNVMKGTTREDMQTLMEANPHFIEWCGDWITFMSARERSKEESVS